MQTVRLVDLRSYGDKVNVALALVCRKGRDGKFVFMRFAEAVAFEFGDDWLRSTGARFVKGQIETFRAFPTRSCVERLRKADVPGSLEMLASAVECPELDDRKIKAAVGYNEPS